MILENNQADMVVLNCRFSGVPSARTDSAEYQSISLMFTERNEPQ